VYSSLNDDRRSRHRTYTHIVVDEDSFVRECFTMRFVDSKGDPLDPVFHHLVEGYH
jgi:hypothetical protein